MTARLLVLFFALGCAGSPAVPAPVVRRPSSTDVLVALLPYGADAVLELDTSRLRANPTIGPSFRRFAARPGTEERLGFNPLERADLVVVAIYGLGTTPTIVAVMRGETLDAVSIAAARDDATALDAHTLAVGDADLRHAVGKGGSMLTDDRFVRLRDAPVPPGAPGASLRFTATWSFDAQVALAGRLGVDSVPETVSLWLDVVDDLAYVALLGGGGEGAERFLAWVGDRARRDPDMAELLRAARATQQGPVTRIVGVVGPTRLGRWAARIAPPEESAP